MFRKGMLVGSMMEVYEEPEIMFALLGGDLTDNGSNLVEEEFRCSDQRILPDPVMPAKATTTRTVCRVLPCDTVPGISGSLLL